LNIMETQGVGILGYSGVFWNIVEKELRALDENKLDEFMKEEGLSNSELARLADLSERTISNVRNNKGPFSDITKNRIIKGLNQNPSKLHDYTLEYIFLNSG